MELSITNAFLQLVIIFLAFVGAKVVKLIYDHFVVKKKVELNEKIDQITLNNMNNEISYLKKARETDKIEFEKRMEELLELSVTRFENKVENKINRLLQLLTGKKETKDLKYELKNLEKKHEELNQKCNDMNSTIVINQNNTEELTRRVINLESINKK
jgi:hypothetical protein